MLCLQSTIKAELTIEEDTETTCRQTLEGYVDIPIFALGKIAESIIASSLNDVYSSIPRIVERCGVRDLHLCLPQAADLSGTV